MEIQTIYSLKDNGKPVKCSRTSPSCIDGDKAAIRCRCSDSILSIQLISHLMCGYKYLRNTDRVVNEKEYQVKSDNFFHTYNKCGNSTAPISVLGCTICVKRDFVLYIMV
jgi:hypothetical protein